MSLNPKNNKLYLSKKVQTLAMLNLNTTPVNTKKCDQSK